MKLAQRITARYLMAKNTGDGKSVGFFIPIPDDLAKLFPSRAPQDTSPPHVTLLVVGDVPKEKFGEFVEKAREVCSTFSGPVRATLGSLEYFVHPAKEQRVAVLKVLFSKYLAEWRSQLHSMAVDLGLNPVADFSPLVYRPHTTLAYLDGFDSVYDGEIPTGSWLFNEVEIWGLPKIHKIPFGLEAVYRTRYMMATKKPAEKEDEEAERLVRPSPKKKPPRKDLRREQMKAESDPDVDVGDRGEDDDLSLNFKRVALRYAYGPFSGRGGKTAAASDKDQWWYGKLFKHKRKHPKPGQEKETEVGWKSLTPEERAQELKRHQKSEVKDVIDDYDLDAAVEEQAKAQFAKLKEKEPDTDLTEDDVRDLLYKRLRRSLAQPLMQDKKITDENIEELVGGAFQETAEELDIDEDREAPEEEAPPEEEEPPAEEPEKPEKKPSPKPKKKHKKAPKPKDEDKDPQKEARDAVHTKIRTSLRKLGLSGDDLKIPPDIKNAVDQKIDEFFSVGEGENSLTDSRYELDSKIKDKQAELEDINSQIKDLKDSLRGSTPEEQDEINDDIADLREQADSTIRELAPLKENRDSVKKQLEERSSLVEKIGDHFASEMENLVTKIPKDSREGWGGPLLAMAHQVTSSDQISNQKKPSGIGSELAKRLMAEKMILNPKRIKNKPFSPSMTMRENWQEERARDSFEQFNHPKMPKKYRTQLGEELVRKLETLDPKSPEAQHHNAVLDGIALAQVLNGEDVTGRPEPSESFRALAKKMNQTRNADQLLRAMRDPTAGVSQEAVDEALDDMDDLEFKEFVGGDDGPFGEMFDALNERDIFGHPKFSNERKDEMLEIMKTMARNNMLLNSTFLDAMLKDNIKDPKERRKKVDSMVEDTTRHAWSKAMQKMNLFEDDLDDIDAEIRKEQAAAQRAVAKQVKTSTNSQSFFYKRPIMNKGLRFAVSDDAQKRKRSMIMARLNKKAAQTVINVLERVANTFQNKHRELGIPEKIAVDFAYRCDLLSDALEKNAGISNELKKQALSELDVVDETKFGPNNYNPDDLGREVSGPLVQETDEAFMSENFSGQEFRELRERQEAGDLGGSVVDTPQKPQAGKQAALDRSYKKLSQMAGEPMGKLYGLGALADKLRVAQAELQNLDGDVGADLAKAVSAAIGKHLTVFDRVRKDLVQMAGKGEGIDDLMSMALDRMSASTEEILPHVKSLVNTLTVANPSSSPEEQLNVEDYLTTNGDRVKRLVNLSADIVGNAGKEFKAIETVED